MSIVSIVIPVFNSERTIEELCERLIEGLAPRWCLQIVLVDDGSRDNSFRACQRLHENYPAVVSAIRLSKNFGEHNAVMAGLNFASGDYCVIMDDDFQNPPSEVEQLIDEISKGYDVVYARYETKEHSCWRNLGSWLHNKLATHALKKPPELYLSSFKALSRFVAGEVIQYTGPDPYLDAIILRTTRNIGVVTTRHQPRHQGASGYTFVKLVSLWSNMFVAFSVYPLRVIGLYGLLMAVVGASYGAYTVLAWLSPALNDPEPLARLNASIWFFRGSTLLMISIIGEYVGRIYKLLTHTPQFVVRQRFLNATPNHLSRSPLGPSPQPQEHYEHVPGA